MIAWRSIKGRKVHSTAATRSPAPSISLPPNRTSTAVSGYAQAEYGNRQSSAAEGAVNLPLNASNAVRIAAYYLDRDYGFSNVGDPRLQPAGLQEDKGARLSFLSEPSDRLSIFLMADYGSESGSGYPGANIHSAIVETGLRPEDLDIREVAYRGQQGELDNELWGVQAKLTVDFDGFTVEYTGSYRELDFYQRNASNDGIAHPGRDLSALDADDYTTVFWEQISESDVHEVRLLSNGDGPLSWSLGGFYFQEDQQSSFFSLADKGYCCYSGTEFIMPQVEGESYAATPMPPSKSATGCGYLPACVIPTREKSPLRYRRQLGPDTRW